MARKKVRVSDKLRRPIQLLAVVGGLFLVIEGILSLLYSQDTRLISDIGRYIRVFIGMSTIIVDLLFYFKGRC